MLSVKAVWNGCCNFSSLFLFLFSCSISRKKGRQKLLLFTFLMTQSKILRMLHLVRTFIYACPYTQMIKFMFGCSPHRHEVCCINTEAWAISLAHWLAFVSCVDQACGTLGMYRLLLAWDTQTTSHAPSTNHPLTLMGTPPLRQHPDTPPGRCSISLSSVNEM